LPDIVDAILPRFMPLMLAIAYDFRRAIFLMPPR